MAIDTPKIEINPYQSSVPLVPLTLPEGDTVPKDSNAPPAFKSSAAGIATIGDSMFRGFLQGHAIKEQRRYGQAMAQYNAGSAALNAARQTYQQAIDSGTAKPNDENDPAFKTYQEQANLILSKLEPLTVPKKPAKGEKKEKGQGFGGKIKDFMEANQHIIPSLAYAAMQPVPLGKTPEGQAQQLKLKAAQQESAVADEAIARDKQADQYKNYVAMHASLKPDEIAKLPPDEQKELAKAQKWLQLNGFDKSGKFITVEDGNGTQRIIQEGVDQVAPGEHVVSTTGRGTPQLWTSDDGKMFRAYMDDPRTKTAKPYVPSKIAPPGSDDYKFQAFMRNRGVEQGKESDEDIAAWEQFKTQNRQPIGKTVSTSSTDVNGNRTTVTTKERGGISAPPKAGQPKAANRASGPLTAPPGKTTLTQANRTQKVETEKANRHRTAQAAFDTQMAAARKLTDPAAQQQAVNQAQQELDNEKGQIGQWYAGQVHAIGGTVAGENTQKPPAGATMVYKDKNGVVKGYAVNGQYVPAGQ